jgi:AcrR family transcriptional regulator
VGVASDTRRAKRRQDARGLATDTRERILAAGRSVFQYGRSATLGEVAAVAGVSRATLHRYFRSRRQLLQELDLDPDPGSRERVLAVAPELIGERGLAALSMEDLAGRAGVSRANLYRLFPGKAALFREVVRTYSPLEPIGARLEELSHRPPEDVMPDLARAVARHVEGRIGFLRSMIFEALGPASEANLAQDFALAAAIRPLIGYVIAQTEAGRLRPMHPLLAVQSFVGPLMIHLVTRPLAERLLGRQPPLETAAAELADVWVRAMRPEPGREA